MSGGLNSYEVTITKDAENFESLAPMPRFSSDHCVAGIDSNMLFTTGLGSHDNETYMYYRDTGEWVQLADMPTGRNSMGCGVVGDGNGMAEVVVVGGELPPFLDTPGNGYDLDTVEIFNVATEAWRTGKNFTNT